MALGALTLKDCAAALNISPRDISAEIHAGRLPAIRVGRRFRIRRSDFDAWQSRNIAALRKALAEPELIPITDGRKQRLGINPT